MDGLSMIARVKANDSEGDAVELDIEIDENLVIITLDSGRSLSINVDLLDAALQKLDFVNRKSQSAPQQ